MSLKDDIKNSLDSFSEPVKQGIKNLGHIGEDISDTIADLTNPIDNGDVEQKDKDSKGCLWPMIKCVFVVLVIIVFVRNGCSFNAPIERDGDDAAQNQTAPVSDSESEYHECIRLAEENISALTSREQIDIEALQEEYEFLLTCKVSEYMFKAMAFGHFTGEYESDNYDSIAEECAKIEEEMTQYLGEETVESMYADISIAAYKAFDDAVFDYDGLLIGSKESPDIDAMWDTYFSSLVGNG